MLASVDYMSVEVVCCPWSTRRDMAGYVGAMTADAKIVLLSLYEAVLFFFALGPVCSC